MDKFLALQLATHTYIMCTYIRSCNLWYIPNYPQQNFPMYNCTYIVLSVLVSIFSVCRPPSVLIGFEFTQYSVQENIRSNSFAFQVCVNSMDVPFPVEVMLEVANNTAEG